MADEMLREQRERLRLGLCLICGHARHLCECGEYERYDDGRQYADDRPERRYE